MRNREQNSGGSTKVSHGRLVGVVRVMCGGSVVDLAIRSMRFAKETDRVAGGFFADNGRLGILVDEGSSPHEASQQIMRATEEAVAHLRRRLLN